MSQLFKLLFFAALDAAMVAAATAVVAILTGYPAEWSIVPAAAVVALKLLEFVAIGILFDLRGKAYDRAVARFYKALSARDSKTAKACLETVERAVAPLYGLMSHVMSWNAVDYNRMQAKRARMIDEARTARDHFNSVNYQDWR